MAETAAQKIARLVKEGCRNHRERMDFISTVAAYKVPTPPVPAPDLPETETAMESPETESPNAPDLQG